jgi:pimeloyl-ACP methyl ester carboxylesterase
VSGVDLVWEQAGSGLPLVLLHGGSGRRQWFASMIDELPPGIASFAPDLPGHGESAHTPGRYQTARVADLVAGFVDEVVGEPAVVFGHSWGGHVAMLLAARHPYLVRGLIVGDSTLSLASHRAHMEADRPRTAVWRELAAGGRPPDEIAAALEDVTILPPGGSELVTLREVFGAGHFYFAEMAASLAAHDPDFLDAVMERFDDTYAGLEATELLPRILCPVLLVQADPSAGGLLRDDDIALARRLLTRVDVARLEGVGHGLQLQAPAMVARAIEPFLERLLESG